MKWFMKVFFISVLFVFAGCSAEITKDYVMKQIDTYVYQTDVVDPQIKKTRTQLIAEGRKLIPTLCALYYEKREDKIYVSEIMSLFLAIDGYDVASKGNEEALNVARHYLSTHDVPCLSAIVYLSFKGEKSDFVLIEKYSGVATVRSRGIIDASLTTLRSRSAGTNLIHGFSGNVYGWNLCRTTPAFVPSVANTGPQAELVFQRIKEELAKVNGDVKKLPPELLTLTIPPPQPVGERFKGKSWLIGAGVLLLAGIGVLVFRKIRKP